MTEIKCIAVDDEPLALELIAYNIKRVPFLKCVATFNSAIKANEFLKNNPIDLVFLDIQMPEQSGMEFAKELNKIMVIFTTAFDKYAMEGFEVAAVDYLLKPIVFERFEKACVKAKEIFELKQFFPEEDPVIIIRSEHRVIKLLLKNIIYIEGLKDYVKVFTIDSEKPILTRTNLKGITGLLPQQLFKRVHKSYTINFAKITTLETDSICLGKTRIPLGDAYKNQVKKDFLKK